MSTKAADAITAYAVHESTGTSEAEPACYRSLHAKISKKTAAVAVCGMGYVGLPLCRAIADHGFPLIGLDIDEEKVEKLNAGKSYIRHIPGGIVQAMLRTGRFRASSDFGQIAHADIIIVCVPTPLTRYREPDLSYVSSTAGAIARNARPGQLVIVESTTYPGTTVELLQPIFSRQGLISGRDIFLAFSPEREDPGNPDYQTTMIPKSVGGQGRLALELATAFYRGFIKAVVPVSSATTAEAVKLTENIFRAVNIALVNELKVIYSKMGIDIWEVIEAAKTKPFGFMPFYPGPGLGGHCIPIDPFYLTWKAREYGRHTRFIELAGEINTAMPEHVVHRVADALNARSKAVKGSRILILGLAYKPNVDDERESPSYVLMDLLSERGAELDYYDPYVPVIKLTREHSHWAGKKSVEWNRATIESFDLVLIATNHSCVNYQELADWAERIVDTRNAMATVQVAPGKVSKA